MSLSTDVLTSSSFFYDDVYVLGIEFERKEGEGHSILLKNGNDPALKLAFLLDGNSLDLLFGIRKGLSRNPLAKQCCENVKRYITSLPHIKQVAVIHFYVLLYTIVCDFHTQVNDSYICCCLFHVWRRDARQAIDREFETLKRNLL